VRSIANLTLVRIFTQVRQPSTASPSRRAGSAVKGYDADLLDRHLAKDVSVVQVRNEIRSHRSCSLIFRQKHVETILVSRR